MEVTTMDDQSFTRQVKGLTIDPGVARRAIANNAAASRCFLVFFTPRSGSSWLTKIVSATGCLGRLEEFINPSFVREVAAKMHATDPATLLAMLQRWARTDNGIFSMEVRAIDVQLLGETEFFAAFDPHTVIYFLWRDNIVAQGISLYRAVTTKRYHSNEAPAGSPEYDTGKICSWMKHIVGIENDNLVLLGKHGLNARFLRYEDIVRDASTTLAMVADAVRVEVTPEQSTLARAQALTKIADDWNLGAEERFRKEQRDFIWGLEEKRLIRKTP